MKKGGFDGPVFAASASFLVATCVLQVVMLSWTRLYRPGKAAPAAPGRGFAWTQSLSKFFAAGGLWGCLLFQVVCEAVMMSDDTGLSRTIGGGMKPFDWGWVISFVGFAFVCLARLAVGVEFRRRGAAAAGCAASELRLEQLGAQKFVVNASVNNFLWGVLMASRNCPVLVSVAAIPWLFCSWTDALAISKLTKTSSMSSSKATIAKTAYVGVYVLGFVVGTPIGMAYNELVPAVLNCLAVGFAVQVAWLVTNSARRSTPWATATPDSMLIYLTTKDGRNGVAFAEDRLMASNSTGEGDVSPAQLKIVVVDEEAQTDPAVQGWSHATPEKRREQQFGNQRSEEPDVLMKPRFEVCDPLATSWGAFMARCAVFFSGSGVALGLVSYHHAFM